jgi:hypothetical protein
MASERHGQAGEAASFLLPENRGRTSQRRGRLWSAVLPARQTREAPWGSHGRKMTFAAAAMREKETGRGKVAARGGNENF